MIFRTLFITKYGENNAILRLVDGIRMGWMVSRWGEVESTLRKALMKREALAAIALHNVLKFGWTWQPIYKAFTLLNTNPEWL